MSCVAADAEWSDCSSSSVRSAVTQRTGVKTLTRVALSAKHTHILFFHSVFFLKKAHFCIFVPLPPPAHVLLPDFGSSAASRLPP